MILEAVTALYAVATGGLAAKATTQLRNVVVGGRGMLAATVVQHVH